MSAPTITEETWVIDTVTINNMVQWIQQLPEPLPTKRGSNWQPPYRRGEIWRPKSLNARVQTLVMGVSGRDPTDGSVPTTEQGWRANLNANIDTLKALFGQYDRQLDLQRVLRLPSGLQTRTAQAEVLGDLGPIAYEQNGRQFATLAVDLNYADPFWYGPSGVAHLAVGSTALANPGTADAWKMTLKFIGPLTNPKLTNSTPDPDVWVKIGAAIGSSHYVLLDTDQFTAVDDAGNNQIGAVTHSGAHPWMLLLQGANTLVLSADSGGGTCDLTFTPPYN